MRRSAGYKLLTDRSQVVTERNVFYACKTERVIFQEASTEHGGLLLQERYKPRMVDDKVEEIWGVPGYTYKKVYRDTESWLNKPLQVGLLVRACVARWCQSLVTRAQQSAQGSGVLCLAQR